MKILAIAGLALTLVACNDPPPSQVNQCLRAEVFKQCMAILPAGPLATKYNDWDEVVSECGSQAYYQSVRKTETIPVECRTQ